MPVVESLVVGGIIAGVGGLTNLIGAWMSGEISESQFKRSLALKERELGASIQANADRLALSEKQVRQQWIQFSKQLEQRKDEFQQTIGLQKEQLGLQKESFEFQKFREIVNPLIEKRRRTKNILNAFSAIAKQGAPRPTGRTPLATAATAPAPTGPVNPLTRST